MSEKDKRPGSTVIRACTCASPYQDKHYGKGQRVHNVGGDPKSNVRKYSCTVCGQTK